MCSQSDPLIYPVFIKIIIIVFKIYVTFIYMCTCMFGCMCVLVCTRMQGKISEDNLVSWFSPPWQARCHLAWPICLLTATVQLSLYLSNHTLLPPQVTDPCDSFLCIWFFFPFSRISTASNVEVLVLYTPKTLCLCHVMFRFLWLGTAVVCFLNWARCPAVLCTVTSHSPTAFTTSLLIHTHPHTVQPHQGQVVLLSSCTSYWRSAATKAFQNVL